MGQADALGELASHGVAHLVNAKSMRSSGGCSGRAASVVGVVASGIRTRQAADNNDVIFGPAGDDSGAIGVEMAAGSAVLYGPVLEGERIAGAGDFASLGTDCSAGSCSHASFSLPSGPGQGTLHELVMLSARPADVGTSTVNVTIEDYRVQLWADATGAAADDRLEVAAGDAYFVVGGFANERRFVTGFNATPIDIRRVRDYWTSSTFTISYVDGDDQAWDLVVMPGRWQ